MVNKTDKKIIELLQNDARIPITRIADEVGLSENGVKYRLEKLEKAKVIKQYAVLLNPNKIGKNVKAIFNIDIDPADVQKALRNIKRAPELIKVYHTSGHYAITAIGLFDSNDDLTNFINNYLLMKCSIKEYTVDIVIREYKESIYLI